MCIEEYSKIYPCIQQIKYINKIHFTINVYFIQTQIIYPEGTFSVVLYEYNCIFPTLLFRLKLLLEKILVYS
jgi:hypothetical protein